MKIVSEILFARDFLLVIVLVLTGCSNVVYEYGESFSPKAELPKIGAPHSSSRAPDVSLNRQGYFGFAGIEVEGSREEALREAAKRGAELVTMRDKTLYPRSRGPRTFGRVKEVIEVKLYRYDPPEAHRRGFRAAMGELDKMDPANVKVFLDLDPNLAKYSGIYFRLVSKLRPSTGSYDELDLYEHPENILEVAKLLIAAGANLNAAPEGIPGPHTPKERLLPGVPRYPTLLQLLEDSLSQPTGTKNVPHERARKVLVELRSVLRGGLPKK